MSTTDNNRHDDDIDDLLTLREVAELLRVPEATLRAHRPRQLQGRSAHPLPATRRPSVAEPAAQQWQPGRRVTKPRLPTIARERKPAR